MKQNVVHAPLAPEGGMGMNIAHDRIRRIALIVMACLIMGLFAGNVLAVTDASSIDFKISIDPQSLKEPGPVTVTATVSNKGAEAIAVPMTLYDESDKVVTSAFDGGVIARLDVNGVSEAPFQWTVTQQQLDAGKLTFYLRLQTEDSTGAITQVSIPAAATIAFAGEKVQLGVQRSVTPEVVRAGSTVTVTYELSNEGTVPLSNIQITENRLISTTRRTVDVIEPGKTATVTFSKKVGNAGVESSAVITYYRQGSKTQLRQTVDTLSVPLAKPGFSSKLTASKTSVEVGETITLTLTLNNKGNINYENVRVSSPTLGDIFTDITLPAGQTVTQTKEITLMAPTTFKFSIALEDNTGTKQTETTNELKISAYAQGQMMNLNVQATADRTSVDSLPGLVRFSVLITNDSNTVAKPVNLYHGTARLASVGELQPGKSVTITRDFNISQAGKFRFTVKTVDALNNEVAFDSNELSVSFSPMTPGPTGPATVAIPPVVTFSPVPAPVIDSTAQTGRDALFIAMIGVGVLAGVSVLLFVVSSLMRAYARRQSDAAYDHLETAPKRDFADPTTYQGETDAAAEAPPSAEDEPTVAPLEEPRELPHYKYLQDDAAPLATATAVPVDAAKVAEEEPTLRTPAEDVPDADDQDEGYQMLREEGEATANGIERRSRRAAKHHKLPDDEE
ncbi:MAG: hypothetical protein GX650_00910 [Clostridiales bacterium]|nr:hypothetical protein [Clostridiales bacterium]